MQLTLKETNVATVGLPMHVINLVVLQTILLTRLLGSAERLMLTGIYMDYQSQTKCLTLQTNYDFLPNLKERVEGLPTSYLMALLPARRNLGLGVNMWGLISTAITCTSALRARAIKMAHHFKSHYSQENK